MRPLNRSDQVNLIMGSEFGSPVEEQPPRRGQPKGNGNQRDYQMISEATMNEFRKAERMNVRNADQMPVRDRLPRRA